MPLKKIKSLTVLFILLILFFVSLLALANALVQTPRVQKILINRLSSATGYELTTGEIEVNLWGGIGVIVHDLVARSKYGPNSFQSSTVRVILNTRELIWGRIVPSSLHLVQPRIDIALENEAAPLAGIKGPGGEEPPLFRIKGIQSIIIEQGRVNLLGRSFHMEAFHLNARQTTPSPLTFKVKAQGRMGIKEELVSFNLDGTISPPSESGTASSVDITLKTGKAPLTWISWPATMPVRSGNFETSLTIKGNLKERTSINGKITTTSLGFSLFRGPRRKDYFIPEMAFELQSLIKEKRISFRPLEITTGDLSMELDLVLDLKNGNNPYVELAANSDFMTIETFKDLCPSPLLPSWLENLLFPMLDSGDIRLDSLTFTGNTGQLKHLRLPENRSVMSLGFECRNMGVSGKGFQIPFHSVSAQVRLENGDLNVSGVKARFGDSFIKDAGLNIKGLLTHASSLEVLMNGSFNIQDLMGQSEMELISPAVSESLNQFRDLRGDMDCNVSIRYEHGWESPKLVGGEFFFNDCLLDKEDLLFPLKLTEAEVHIYENHNNIFRGSGSWGNTEFDLTGGFLMPGHRLDIQDVDISADMDMNQLIPAVFKWNKPPLKFDGLLPLQMSVLKEKDIWSCEGRMDLEGIALKTETLSIYPLSGDNIISFRWEINPREIDVKEITYRLNDSAVELSGRYSLEKDGSCLFNIRSDGLSIQYMGIHAGENGIPVTGALKGDLDIAWSARDVRDINISGLLEGKGLSLVLSMLSPPISDCSFRLSFSGKQALIENTHMNLGQSPVRVTGLLERWDAPSGDIKIEADSLNLSSLLSTEHRHGLHDRTRKDNGLPHNTDINIDLDIRRGVWRKLPLERITAEMNLRQGGLYIRDSRIALENGNLNVNGYIKSGEHPYLLFSGDVRFTDQPIDELLEGLEFDNRNLKGSLTAEAQLTVTGKSKKDMIPSLHGQGKVTINQGLFKKSRVFIKVLEFLSLQKIYKKRPAGLEGEGFYFEEINADLKIDQGILESENFKMKSPVFNAVAYGTLDIPQGLFDFVLGVQPHGTIDNLMNKIPVLGHIITGDKGSVLLYPFKVNGPFSDPTVKFVPLETIVGGVAGVTKRLLLSPLKILEDLTNITKTNGQ
jgi:hypothetical protein